MGGGEVSVWEERTLSPCRSKSKRYRRDQREISFLSRLARLGGGEWGGTVPSMASRCHLKAKH